jgi:uncharacterized membrane protein YraQ (UPF0718 family)
MAPMDLSDLPRAILDALRSAGEMGWLILWPLVLGFALSGAIQAVGRPAEVRSLLPDDSPRSLATAAGLGAASSSCSYAAVALARALVRTGASFTAAMAFQVAATNLVLEIGIVTALLLGWQFTLAEFVGGPLMILAVALLFRWWVSQRVLDAARTQADRGLAGSMEGHAAMDMSVHGDASFLRRLATGPGFTSTSEYFVMDSVAVWRDVVGGLLVAGAFAAWVPTSWLQSLFLDGHPVAAKVFGPLLGPLLAMVSFVCSVGNIPLAGVLWNGGISFGGVVSFIFADLLIVPILLIYRKYYRTAMTVRIFAVFYVAMAGAGYVVELVFTPLGLVPSTRDAQVTDIGIGWNYTTWLNIMFLVVAAALVWRFVRSGGLPMLRRMNGDPAPVDGNGHDHHH